MGHLELLNIHMTFDNRKNGLPIFFPCHDTWKRWSCWMRIFLFILHFVQGDIVHNHVNVYDYHYSQPSIKNLLTQILYQKLILK